MAQPTAGMAGTPPPSKGRAFNQFATLQYEAAMAPAVPFPCYVMALDVETTGDRLGVDKLVAIGAVLVQLRGPFDVVEVERQTWRFEAKFPEDFEPGCVEQFWSKNMEVLHQLQEGALEPKEAIQAFYDWFSSICSNPAQGNFFLVTDNPAFDVAFVNLYLCRDLGLPPLTNRAAATLTLPGHPLPAGNRSFVPPVDVRSLVCGLPTSMLTAGRPRRAGFTPAPWGSPHALTRNVLSAVCPGQKTHMPADDAFLIAWHFGQLASYVEEQAAALQEHLNQAAAMGITGNDMAVPGSYLHTTLGLRHTASASPTPAPRRRATSGADVVAAAASMASRVTFSPVAGAAASPPPPAPLPHDHSRPSFIASLVQTGLVTEVTWTPPSPKGADAPGYCHGTAKEACRVAGQPVQEIDVGVTGARALRLLHFVHRALAQVLHCKKGHYSLPSASPILFPCVAVDMTVGAMMRDHYQRWSLEPPAPVGLPGQLRSQPGILTGHGTVLPAGLLDALLSILFPHMRADGAPHGTIAVRLPYDVVGRALASSRLQDAAEEEEETHAVAGRVAARKRILSVARSGATIRRLALQQEAPVFVAGKIGKVAGERAVLAWDARKATLQPPRSASAMRRMRRSIRNRAVKDAELAAVTAVAVEGAAAVATVAAAEAAAIGSLPFAPPSPPLPSVVGGEEVMPPLPMETPPAEGPMGLPGMGMAGDVLGMMMKYGIMPQRAAERMAEERLAAESAAGVFSVGKPRKTRPGRKGRRSRNKQEKTKKAERRSHISTLTASALLPSVGAGGQ